MAGRCNFLGSNYVVGTGTGNVGGEADFDPDEVGSLVFEGYQWVGSNTTQYSSLAGDRRIFGQVTGDAAATRALISGAILAWPHIVAKDQIIDEVYAEVTLFAAAQNFRIAMYTNTSRSILYPDALVAESANLSGASTGVRTVSTSITLLAGNLVWIAVNSSSSSITLRGLLDGSSHGWTNVGTNIVPLNHIQVGATFGAFPDPFPGGATGSRQNVPAIAYRLSA